MCSGIIYQSPTPPFKSSLFTPIKGGGAWALVPLRLSNGASVTVVQLGFGRPKRGSEVTEQRGRRVWEGAPLPW